MSASFYRKVVALLERFGVPVSVTDGAWTRSNGLTYPNGQPDGSLAHHFVAPITYAQPKIDELVRMCITGYSGLPGPVIPWVVDCNGRAYLIAAGPANHAGLGNSSVLAAVRADRQVGPPPGPGDLVGNGFFSGIEALHPGDSTPYPGALLNTMSAVHAAEVVIAGWSVRRILQHWQWTTRKVDMSFGGGPSRPGSAADYLAGVAAWVKLFQSESETKAPTSAPASASTPAPVGAYSSEEDTMLLVKIYEDADPRRVYALNLARGTVRHVKEERLRSVIARAGATRVDGKGQAVDTTLMWGELRDLLQLSGLSDKEAVAQIAGAGFVSAAQKAGAK